MTLRRRLEAVLAKYPWIAMALTLVVAIRAIDTLPVGVFHDDGHYLILAKALATGQGYSWINLPGSPPATHFPPGYPAVLAVFWWLFPAFPANVLLFKALNALFVAGAAAGVAILARTRLGFSPAASALIAIAGCAAVPTLTLSTILLSEPLFLAALVFVLPWAERVVEGNPRVRSLVLAGIVAALATLVRSIGIALVAAIAAVLVLRRRWRDAAIVMASALVLLLPWQIWVTMHDDAVPAVIKGIYASYGSWYADGFHAEGGGLALVWRTFERSAAETGRMFATLGAVSLPGWARTIALLSLAALFTVGSVRFWRSARVTLSFLALYVLIVMIWPFGPTRFFMCLWPIIVLLAVTGGREIALWRPGAGRLAAPMWGLKLAALAGVALVAASHLRYNARGYRGDWWSSIPRIQTRLISPIVVWARARTRPDEILATSAGTMVYLYSGRLAVPTHAFTVQDYFRPASASEKEEGLRAILSAYDVDAIAVVADDTLMRVAQSMATRTPPELVHRANLRNGLVFAPATSLTARSR